MRYPWHSILLEAESTPGPQCDRKDYVSENHKDPMGLSGLAAETQYW